MVYQKKIKSNDSTNLKSAINTILKSYRDSLTFLPKANIHKDQISYQLYSSFSRKGKDYGIIDCFIPYHTNLIRIVSCICFNNGFPSWDLDTAAFPDLYKNRMTKIQVFQSVIHDLINSFSSLYEPQDSALKGNLFGIASKAFHENKKSNYLLPLIRLRENKPLQDTVLNSYYDQASETYQCLAGNYDSTYRYRKILNQQDSTNTKDSLAFIKEFTGYQPYDAAAYIKENTLGKRVVMFNESHVNYQLRRFEENLLSAFYKAGFKYLAVEGLDYKDSLLNQRKYPVVNSGFYIVEPGFGNYIRKALELGFTLVAYEDTTTCTNKIENCNFHRDSMQAVNISQILKRDPQAKILVHAGYGHIQKKKEPNWYPLALRLKMMTGIEPYCINQTLLSEKGFGSFSSMTRFIHYTYHPAKPVVFLNTENITFEPKSELGNFDLLIYHPYRPDLFESDSTNGYLKKINIESPVITATPQEFIVQVYLEKELDQGKEEAIPVFQKTFFSKFDKFSIYLPSNHYRILLKDQNGNELSEDANEY